MSSTPGPFILFTTIWNILVPPIQSGETAIIAALQAYVTTWFALAVGVYLMAILLMAALNPSEADATLLFRKAFLAGVVWSLAATTAGFSTYITGFTNGAVTSVSTVYCRGIWRHADNFSRGVRLPGNPDDRCWRRRDEARSLV